MRHACFVHLPLIIAVIFSGCAVDNSKEQRQQAVGAQSISEPEEEEGLVRATESDDFVAAKSPIKVAGTKVYIVCFYGGDDHDDIARNMCNQKMRECVASYGARSCEKIVNPDRAALERIKNEGMVIVVTHTTPDPTTECKTGVGIWDAKPGVTPSVVSECIDAPIIWFGCYSAGIAEQCPNVIPLADKPEILDSREPKVQCRFRASSACIEEFIKNGRPFTQEDVQACVERKMGQMCPGL